MAAILFVTWHLYRATATQRTASNKKKQAAQPAKNSKSVPAKANKADKPTDKEQELLQELLDLDKAYEAGKLTKAVYQERRAKTKAKLRALMKEKVSS
jgi:hypothetical protein